MTSRDCILFVATLTAAACSDSKTPITNTPDASADSITTQSNHADASALGSGTHASGSSVNPHSSTTRDEGDAEVEGPETDPTLAERDSGTLPDAKVHTTTDAEVPSTVEASTGDAQTTAQENSNTTTPDSGNPNDPSYRFCSNDPLDTVTWECDEQGQDCTTLVNQGKCPLPWGCDDYSTAVQTASDRCPTFILSLTTYEACGFSVIERRIGAGDPLRGFYNSSGELVGTWSTTDTFDPERCSGYVPEACIDYFEDEDRASVQDLCTDAGANTDVDEN